MLKKDSTKRIPYHTAFVVNPTAGDGKAGRIWPLLEELLYQTGQPYRAYFTRCKGDGPKLAARASYEGAELIVAVGGDGTLKEVLNGLDLDKNILGVIPAGTGNGFIRSLFMPLQWEKAFQGLARWNPRRIDIGRFNHERFLNSVGIGLDGAVAEAASSRYKHFKGYLAHTFALIDQVPKFSRFKCRVICNGMQFEDDQTLIALVANGRFYGGKLCIAPQASVDDGYLDLLLIRKRSIPELLSIGIRVAVRKHLSNNAVTTMRGCSFFLETSRLLPVQVDGDPLEGSSLEVDIMPAALQVLTPGTIS